MTNEKRRRILTLTLNPAMDVFVHVDQLYAGTLHRASEFRKNPGGKGINVSKALKAFGTSTVAAGFIGGHNGDWIESELDNEGISTRFIRIAEETRMNVKVVEAQGKLTELNSPSPGLEAGDWSRLEEMLEQIGGENSWIAFCGNLPGNGPPDWYEKMIHRCHKLGINVAVDTSGEALQKAIRAKPDFIKPNIEELEELTGKNIATIEEAATAAKELAET
ncbi:MAG TPA: hexose kinase, partial [Bacillales bacterium]